MPPAKQRPGPPLFILPGTSYRRRMAKDNFSFEKRRKELEKKAKKEEKKKRKLEGGETEPAVAEESKAE